MHKTAAGSSPLPNALGAAAELLAAALAAFPAAAHALAHRRRTRRQRHVLAFRLDPQWAYVNAVLRSQHVSGALQPFRRCCLLHPSRHALQGITSSGMLLLLLLLLPDTSR